MVSLIVVIVIDIDIDPKVVAERVYLSRDIEALIFGDRLLNESELTFSRNAIELGEVPAGVL